MLSMGEIASLLACARQYISFFIQLRSFGTHLSTFLTTLLFWYSYAKFNQSTGFKNNAALKVFNRLINLQCIPTLLFNETIRRLIAIVVMHKSSCQLCISSTQNAKLSKQIIHSPQPNSTEFMLLLDYLPGFEPGVPPFTSWQVY